MRLVHFRSDFDLLLKVRDLAGNLVEPDRFDWRARFYTSGCKAYEASRIKGKLTNCRIAGEGVIVTFDSHGLMPGDLWCELTAYADDPHRPEGVRPVVVTERTGVRLTTGRRDYPDHLEGELVLGLLDLNSHIREELDGIHDAVDGLGERAVETERRISDICVNQHEVETEFRREIIGLWDATAAIQAKLADLYSTETRNLLTRLGYGEEDIEEYIWAVGHLDLDITLDDLRHSVKVFEKWKEGNFYCSPEMSCSVMPKWTEEMEAGDSSPLEFVQRLVYSNNVLKYLPHLDTSRTYNDMWLRRGFTDVLQYAAGVHARTDSEIVIENCAYLKGIGSVTGRVRSFRLGTRSTLDKLVFIRKFKSDIPVDLSQAFEYAAYLTDFSGVDFSNATSLQGFSKIMRTPPICITTLGENPLPQGIPLHEAFWYRSFRDTTFVLGGDKRLEIRGIFGALGSVLSLYAIPGLPTHENCLIKFTGNGVADDHIWDIGTIAVPYRCTSRIEAHGMENFNLKYQIGEFDTFRVGECGVWEIDCPRLRSVTGYNLYTSASLLNIGENIPPHTNLPIGYIMPREWKFAAESFRNSLKTWKPVPGASRPCTVSLFPQHLAVLSEEEIANLADKGYTISVYSS